MKKLFILFVLILTSVALSSQPIKFGTANSYFKWYEAPYAIPPAKPVVKRAKPKNYATQPVKLTQPVIEKRDTTIINNYNYYVVVDTTKPKVVEVMKPVVDTNLLKYMAISDMSSRYRTSGMTKILSGIGLQIIGTGLILYGNTDTYTTTNVTETHTFEYQYPVYEEVPVEVAQVKNDHVNTRVSLTNEMFKKSTPTTPTYARSEPTPHRSAQIYARSEPTYARSERIQSRLARTSTSSNVKSLKPSSGIIDKNCDPEPPKPPDPPKPPEPCNSCVTTTTTTTTATTTTTTTTNTHNGDIINTTNTTTNTYNGTTTIYNGDVTIVTPPKTKLVMHMETGTVTYTDTREVTKAEERNKTPYYVGGGILVAAGVALEVFGIIDFHKANVYVTQNSIGFTYKF